MNDVADSEGLEGRRRRSLLQSQVMSLIRFDVTVNGRSKLDTRDNARGHLSTLGLPVRLAVIGRSGKKHEIGLLIDGKVLGNNGEPRGLGLGEPYLLMIIRDERLEVV